MGLKKRFWKPLVGLVMILAVAGFTETRWANGAEGDVVTLPVPKQFISAKTADGREKYVSITDIENEIRRYSPGLQEVFYNKQLDKFIVPDPRWVIHLLGAYEELLSSLNIEGQSQTWDCENYSAFLNALTTIKIWQAGYWDTHAAFGWLKVNAQKEWAGMPGERHALMFTETGKGIYIIEPQNGQYVHISKYPNNTFIEEVYLF